MRRASREANGMGAGGNISDPKDENERDQSRGGVWSDQEDNLGPMGARRLPRKGKWGVVLPVKREGPEEKQNLTKQKRPNERAEKPKVGSVEDQSGRGGVEPGIP